MSALANFKANLVKGKQCMFTAKWCPVPTLRTIVEVRSKDVGFTHPNPDKKEASWLNFPKKNEVSEPTPNKFIIAFSDVPDDLTYDFNLTA
jgi:hypothetical protein